MQTDFLFARRTVGLLILTVSSVSFTMLVLAVSMSEGFVFPSGGLVGGDHIAFWTAARAALDGAWIEAYDTERFNALLHANGTAIEEFGLTWQYPPHAALVLAPFGLMPYALSWVVWSTLSVGLFASALHRAGQTPWLDVALVVLSPVMFQVIITGQTGAFFGAALICALMLPDRRPVVAGICAGLLTMKPQLGLLLPFAYVAGGHYRTFGIAAATAGALVIVSTLWLGPEAWQTFVGALLGVGEGVAEARYPLEKMVTVFAALRTGDVPASIAFGVQTAAFLAVAALTVRVWRSAATGLARASITACLIFLTTPYAYYYDLAVLALPFLYIVSQMNGAATAQRLLLVFLWMVPLWIVSFQAYGAFLGLSGILILTILTLRTAAPLTRLSLSPA